MGQTVKKCQAGRDVRGFVVVLAGFEFKAGRWGNAQVDVFREPLNQPKPFGRGLAMGLVMPVLAARSAGQ
jgi:hypothetical protein